MVSQGAGRQHDLRVLIFDDGLAVHHFAYNSPTSFALRQMADYGSASTGEELLIHECSNIFGADMPSMSAFPMFSGHECLLNAPKTSHEYGHEPVYPSRDT